MHKSNDHKRNHTHHQTRLVYSYEKERQKKLAAYALLLTGLFVFILTLTGFTDSISNWTNSFLLDKLGYTNKWSERFGPTWLLHFVDDIAALGGKVVLLLGVSLVAIYYKIRKEYKLLWKFLIVISIAVIIMIIIKLMFADEAPYEPIDLLISNVADYPSGHAMLAIVFYLTLAVLLTRRQRRKIVRIYTLISAIVIISAIGISRVVGAAHTVTEVLAGWSLGLIWLCLCWLTERYLGMKLDSSKSHSHSHNTSS
jgi:undecaprenyl-diphosphatase